MTKDDGRPSADRRFTGHGAEWRDPGLAPEQARVVTVSEKSEEYARGVEQKLRLTALAPVQKQVLAVAAPGRTRMGAQTHREHFFRKPGVFKLHVHHGAEGSSFY